MEGSGQIRRRPDKHAARHSRTRSHCRCRSMDRQPATPRTLTNPRTIPTAFNREDTTEQSIDPRRRGSPSELGRSRCHRPPPARARPRSIKVCRTPLQTVVRHLGCNVGTDDLSRTGNSHPRKQGESGLGPGRRIGRVAIAPLIGAYWLHGVAPCRVATVVAWEADLQT